MSELRQIGKWNVLTPVASYVEGYNTGLNWDAPWIPGGPWYIYPDQYNHNADWEAYCKATLENNKEWLRGWQDGVKDQTATVTHPDKYYPRWSTPRPAVCNCGYHRIRATVDVRP